MIYLIRLACGRFQVSDFFGSQNISSNGQIYTLSDSIFENFIGSSEDFIIKIVEESEANYNQLKNCLLRNNECGNMIFLNNAIPASSNLISKCCFHNNIVKGDNSILVASLDIQITDCVFTINNCSEQLNTGMISFQVLQKEKLSNNNISDNIMSQGIGSTAPGMTCQAKIGNMVFEKNTLSASNSNRYKSGDFQANFFEVYSNSDTADYFSSVYVNNTLSSGCALFFIHNTMQLNNCFIYMHDDSSDEGYCFLTDSSAHLTLNNCMVRRMSYVGNLAGWVEGTYTKYPAVEICENCGPKASSSPNPSPSLSPVPTKIISNSQSPSLFFSFNFNKSSSNLPTVWM